jgi:hypothetical protein
MKPLPIHPRASSAGRHSTFCLGVLLLASAAASAQLMLTEIQSSQAAAGMDDYWELTNFGESPVDISGYRWHDSGRNFEAAAGSALPSGTLIAPGESVIFSRVIPAATFRTWWGIDESVKVFQWAEAPGLGQNDAITLFDSAGNELFFFSYAANGFTRADGTAATGNHAGLSAGGAAATQALVWLPASGLDSPRYTFADGTNHGSFQAATGADLGSPGFAGAPPAITLALGLSATPAIFSESAAIPAATGTVTRTGSTATELVVELFSNDTTEATVPTSVTIQVGESSATFAVSAVDDSFPDGDQTVTLSATADGAEAATFDIIVQDDGDVFTPKLLVTEIQSNQSPGTSGRPTGTGDYWELTNFGDGTVSLEGWRWHDEGRNFVAAAGSALPAGSEILPGESVIFTATDATLFRQWWGISAEVKVFTWSGAPGLGQNDGISLFEPGGNEVFFFSYAADTFTILDEVIENELSYGTHAGPSAGGTLTYQALIINPQSTYEEPKYSHADGVRFGSFTAAFGFDLGSPGIIDETAAPTVTLSLSINPDSFPENAANPAAAGTVTRSGSTALELEVNLSSSDTTEATVPSVVVIPVGQSSATFEVNAVDDQFPDGDQMVFITASAPGVISGSYEIVVEDDGSDTFTAKLLLTELQSNQSPLESGRPATAGDYWELTNFGDEEVSLAGYRWDDDSRNFSLGEGSSLPEGTVIAPGESVIFTTMDPMEFRQWWGVFSSVQVFQWVGGPGLGSSDGIALFEPGGNEVFFFSYGAGGFTVSGGDPSFGGHAGISAGGAEAFQALIWDPTSSYGEPRYTFADGTLFGSSKAANGDDLGSPGRVDSPAGGTVYQDWLGLFGISPAAPKARPEEDFDNDGSANFVEFALGGNPASGADDGIQSGLIAEVEGSDTLVITIAVREGAQAPVFAGTPSPSATVDGVTYTIEGSLGLADGWNAVVEEISPAVNPGGTLVAPNDYELRSFRLVQPADTGFLRVKLDPVASP